MHDSTINTMYNIYNSESIKYKIQWKHMGIQVTIKIWMVTSWPNFKLENGIPCKWTRKRYCPSNQASLQGHNHELSHAIGLTILH